MISLINLLTVIIVFLSLYFGVGLAYIAKEELEISRKYFDLTKKALFIIIICALIYKNYTSTIKLVFSILAMTIYFVSLNKKVHDILTYAVFALALYFSIQDLMIPSLMFIYGLIQGTIITQEAFKTRRENKLSKIIKTIFIRYVWLIVINIGLYFI